MSPFSDQSVPSQNRHTLGRTLSWGLSLGLLLLLGVGVELLLQQYHLRQHETIQANQPGHGQRQAPAEQTQPAER